MSSDLRISPRDRLVLNAIIELYIATGEPVASQTVARQLDNKDGMSAATIRNVMAALGEAGLLGAASYLGRAAARRLVHFAYTSSSFMGARELCPARSPRSGGIKLKIALPA